MKVFVLDSSHPSHWHSLNSIYQSLRDCLRASSLELVWLDHAQPEAELVLKDARARDRVYALAAEVDLTTALKHCPREVPILLPIYGDMTIEFRRWAKYDDFLRGRPLKFLAATPRSAAQVHALVKAADVALLPYPVAPAYFHAPLASQQGKMRLFYAGRLTAQKNVLDLMRAVLSANRNGADARLTIAGDFHERGYHFHSLLVDEKKFRELFEQALHDSQGAIQYRGMLDEAELLDEYAQASHVVSLSTYHDEDYGMSVAQGMAMGRAPWLSDWGGHGFFLSSGLGHSVPVELDGYSIPRPRLIPMIKRLMAPLSAFSPQQVRDWASEHFSQGAVTRKWEQLCQQEPSPYHGQSETFSELVAAFLQNQDIPFHHKSAGFRELYLKVYSSYLGPC